MAPPRRLVVRALRALDFTLISQHFSKKLIRWSYMSLETGQILQDIGLSATISQLWGQNRLSLAAILAHELLGGAHHTLGSTPPTRGTTFRAPKNLIELTSS